MASLNLTTPWVEHYNKIEAFFKRDPEVKVIYDNDEKLVKLLVNNGEKQEHLMRYFQMKFLSEM